MEMLGALAATSAYPSRGVTSATVCGPITGPVGSIMGLPAVVRWVKIGTPPTTVNRFGDHMTPAVSLAAGIVALLLWIVLAFAVPVAAGAVHLLLAAGVVLLVRWYALTQ